VVCKENLSQIESQISVRDLSGESGEDGMSRLKLLVNDRQKYFGVDWAGVENPEVNGLRRR
jgi:hypothetical protein